MTSCCIDVYRLRRRDHVSSLYSVIYELYKHRYVLVALLSVVADIGLVILWE